MKGEPPAAEQNIWTKAGGSNRIIKKGAHEEAINILYSSLGP